MHAYMQYVHGCVYCNASHGKGLFVYVFSLAAFEGSDLRRVRMSTGTAAAILAFKPPLCEYEFA